jgi:predicted lipoprotein with Yx(FWY)xxD motif
MVERQSIPNLRPYTNENETGRERNRMELADRPQTATRRRALRIITAALAVGWFAASTVVVASAGAASTHKAKRVVISTANNAQLGTILVSGKTVYTLSKPKCTGTCLTIWPAVVLPRGVKKATAGVGVTATKLGVMRRAHGIRQVTYSGKPLYWFVEDTAPGQVLGNNVSDQWGTWSVFVTAAPATTAPTPASGAAAPAATPAATTPPPTAPAHPTSPPAATPATTTPPPTTPPPTTPPHPASPPPTTTPTTAPMTTTPASGGVAY